MNHRALLLVLAAGVLASCGKQPTSRVQFVNFTPHSELEKDYRSIRAFCPKCNAPVDATLDKCPKTFSSGENCEFQLVYADEYTCAFCNGKKTCPVCIILEQKDGKCYNCKGAGVLTYLGKAVTCPGCKGTKVCKACKGQQTCDYCKGEGTLSGDFIRQKALKPSEDGKWFQEPAVEAAPAGSSTSGS